MFSMRLAPTSDTMGTVKPMKGLWAWYARLFSLRIRSWSQPIAY